MRLILASQSSRRKDLLTMAGFEFTVRARPVEELRGLHEPPREYVIRLAREKAEAAWEDRDEIVLGADTTVVLGEAVLEKPRDVADASSMLRQLSGHQHTVLTGICLRHQGGAISDYESTLVKFAELSEEEIASYVA